MSIEVKICGLSTEAAIAVAAEGGARYVGLVLYPPSPRNVSVRVAARLAASAPESVAVVALLVDPDDALVEAVAREVKPAMLQLHGAETPERVKEVRVRAGLQVMKAIKVAADEDFAAAALYAGAADRLLFDAKPPASLEGALPGGNAVTFDWRLLKGRSFVLPWMLSGGLDPDNVAEAVRVSGATAVDVSSGVETRPGVKDLDKIRAFLKAALQN